MQKGEDDENEIILENIHDYDCTLAAVSELLNESLTSTTRLLATVELHWLEHLWDHEN